jgi:hypothetical protein
MASTNVAEAWPEDRRRVGAGYLQTGQYFGFFAALPTIGILDPNEGRERNDHRCQAA